jgi:hypothetical protein
VAVVLVLQPQMVNSLLVVLVLVEFFIQHLVI